MTRAFVFLGAVLRYMIDNDTLCTCLILVFLVLYRTFVALNLVSYACCSCSSNSSTFYYLRDCFLLLQINSYGYINLRML